MEGLVMTDPFDHYRRPGPGRTWELFNLTWYIGQFKKVLKKSRQAAPVSVRITIILIIIIKQIPCIFYDIIDDIINLTNNCSELIFIYCCGKE